jgi:hypothetical protein
VLVRRGRRAGWPRLHEQKQGHGPRREGWQRPGTGRVRYVPRGGGAPRRWERGERVRCRSSSSILWAPRRRRYWTCPSGSPTVPVAPTVGRIDLSQRLPPIGRQVLNDCVAWASAYYLRSYLWAKQSGRPAGLARAAILADVPVRADQRRAGPRRARLRCARGPAKSRGADAGGRPRALAVRRASDL